MTNQKVVVVTDSTGYIPQEALGDLRIPTIPLWLLWGEERFRDGVDISPPEFYRRLTKSKEFPTTSQPSAGEFIEFFRQAGGQADTVVGIFISSKLSGTVPNAQAAQAQMSRPTVHVIDSLSTAMSMGFIVLDAARAALAGKSAAEVVAVAEDIRERVGIIFAVDTLEYLHRGGRIGGARRFVGTALNIKPLLQLVDGAIEPLGQVRTKRKAVAQMLDCVEEQLGGRRMLEATTLDVNSPAEGDALAQQIRDRFGVSRVYRTTVSPVIGAHVGPGTVGVAFKSEP
ncbi:MAG TPA: DegV family protein [Chloroflexi bacterium]|nr:DegV family protein [Chloroflexota bacterium]